MPDLFSVLDKEPLGFSIQYDVGPLATVARTREEHSIAVLPAPGGTVHDRGIWHPKFLLGHTHPN